MKAQQLRPLSRRFIHLVRTQKPRIVLRRLSSWIRRSLTAHNRTSFDEAETVFELLEQRLAGAGIMVDVGAHRGNTLHSFLTAGWDVYAYEPDPETRAELTASYGSIDRLRISDRAVTSSPGQQLSFYTSPKSKGISGLSAFDETHSSSFAVETTSLDKEVERHRLDRIDFLKIDVEGFDLDVMRGLDTGQLLPQVVMLEFEDAKTEPLGHTWQDIATYLADCGYVVAVSEWQPISSYGGDHQWQGCKTWPCELEVPQAWGNLLGFSSPELNDAFLSKARGTQARTDR